VTRYRAVLFDLFDTLVFFERQRLPVVRVDGRAVHSTAGLLHEVLRSFAPEVDLATLLDGLVWSWQEAERLRAIDHREVAAPERFAMLFRRLGFDPRVVPAGLVEGLLEAHRRGLTTAMEFPPHHSSLLRRLTPGFRLAVVSNFDYTPTARGVLEAAGVDSLFAEIVVSDAVGWRKPHPVIFEATLRRLGVGAREALFVGDRAEIDVVGAQAVEMDVVWVNRGPEGLPPGVAPPTHEIRDLAELEAILSV
jgi:putative hydrolase of the HAD superfamily